MTQSYPKFRLSLIFMICFGITTWTNACSSYHPQEDDQTIAELSSNHQKTKFKRNDGVSHEEDRTENQMLDDRLSLNDLERLSVTDAEITKIQTLDKISKEQLKQILDNLTHQQTITIDLEFKSDALQQIIQCSLKGENASVLLTGFLSEEKSGWTISRIMPRLMIELNAVEDFRESLSKNLAALTLKPDVIDMKSGDLFWHAHHQNIIILEKPMPWHLDELVYLGHCPTLDAIRVINRTAIIEGHQTALDWQISLVGLQSK